MELTKKQIRAEEKEFRRIEKMIEKKDRKALEREIRKFGKEERASLRKLKKDNWL